MDSLKVQGCHNIKSTATFCQIFDQVFDCLNVSRLNQDKKEKRERAAYKGVDDWRFDIKLEIRVSWEFLNLCWQLPSKDKNIIFLQKTIARRIVFVLSWILWNLLKSSFCFFHFCYFYFPIMLCLHYTAGPRVATCIWSIFFEVQRKKVMKILP